MVQIVKQPPPPKVYIEEWMPVRGFQTQKALAETMGTGESNITKKLANRPELLNLAWLGWFAAALDVRPEALFRDPREMNETELALARPKVSALLRAAVTLSDSQIDNLTALFSPPPSSAPPRELPPAFQAEPPSKAPPNE